jgi:hypothetical protein
MQFLDVWKRVTSDKDRFDCRLPRTPVIERDGAAQFLDLRNSLRLIRLRLPRTTSDNCQD